MAKSDETLFTVRLEKGLAERKRLPLAHVLNVLDELRQLIVEIGKDAQFLRGATKPTGDFGLELVAGDRGIAFKAGSVQASIALTERPGTGYRVVQSVLETIDLLNREDSLDATKGQQIDGRVIRRLSRIAEIQKRDHTQMRLSLARPSQPKPVTATFGPNGIAAVRSLQAPTFRVQATVLYGKLFELIDRTADDDEEKGFWGELAADSGEAWRIRFRTGDEDKATSLFRKQVRLTGTAVYYRVARPKLICETVERDTDRDFEAAFEELYGCDKQLYKGDLQTLLKQLHGDE